MGLPKVVILGGGPGGLATARALHGAADVTLVEPKAFHEINWGSLRAMVEPEFADSIVFPYEEVPNIGTVLRSCATGFTSSTVSLDSGKQLSFDFLVVATGSTYPSAVVKDLSGSLAERKASFQNEYEKLKAASGVLIIGGGAVGVELAGEIVTDLPGTLVTVVTAADRLLADKRPKLGAKAQSFLEGKGAKIITGQRAARQPDGSWAATDGQKLIADLVYETSGGKPNTAFLLGSPCLNERGFVKVNDALQVEGHTNVFAVGDVTNVPETKLGYLAGLHAAIVCANIKALAKSGGGGAPKLKRHKPFGGPEMMMVSLGRKNGVFQLPGGFVVGGFLPTYVKSGDMLAGKTRKSLGMKAQP